MERTIEPLRQPLSGRVRVPGSKSLTNRAMILAALAEPGPQGADTILTHALAAEDTELMAACLAQLNIPIDWDRTLEILRVTAAPRAAWPKEARFFCGNSGTTIRFLAALLSLGHGRFELDGTPRMRQRPIEPLLDALRQLGVHAESIHGSGCPPIRIESQGLSGGSARISGEASSQFLSALLMVAPRAAGPIDIAVEGPLVSWPYVQMTQRVVDYFADRTSDSALFTTAPPASFAIRPLHYFTKRLEIEPDASSASYFLAGAAITGGRMVIEGLNRSSWQGDAAFVDVLASMGCTVEETANPPTLTLVGGPLRGIDVDMNTISDTVMSLAVVALFAQGPTTIRGVAHIRWKESDRLAALAAELRRLGAHVTEQPDGLHIEPAPLRGASLNPHGDHRLAMAFSLIGLRVPGILIQEPDCVAKTYPTFFQHLDKLRGTCESR